MAEVGCRLVGFERAGALPPDAGFAASRPPSRLGGLQRATYADVYRWSALYSPCASLLPAGGEGFHRFSDRILAGESGRTVLAPRTILGRIDAPAGPDDEARRWRCDRC